MTYINHKLDKQDSGSFSKLNSMVPTTCTDGNQKLIYDFQLRQNNLEIQNEKLRRSQDELIESRNYYEQLYNASPISYVMLTSDGVIQDVNAAASFLLGVTKVELINKSLTQFIFDSDKELFNSFINGIISKHKAQTITVQLTISNQKNNYPNSKCSYYCDLPSSCLYNNDFIYAECQGHSWVNDNNQICLSIINITKTILAYKSIACLNEKMAQRIFEQNRSIIENNQALVKQVEELSFYKNQLVEREIKLNSIFNAALEGIITTDMSGTILSVNNAVEKIFGYSKEELAGLCISNIIPLQNVYLIPHYWLNEENGNVREVAGLHKNGFTIALDVSITKFTIDEADYLTSIIRDVTARKLQEQRDQEHLDELAHVTRIGLMGEMASGIAHEVNQPLTAIANYTQASINLIQNSNYDQALLNEVLLKINQQALKAGQIIHRMRNFVKFNTVHRSDVDMNNLIHDAVGLCESNLKQNKILLRLQLETNLPHICVDNIQIEQVILNLMRNSIEALTNLPPLVPRVLCIQTTMNNENQLEIRIKDNGPGIDASEQNKILTPFFTTKSDGMGMGLSICRSIVESHEGILRFNSLPNKGTTFYFTLPARIAINGK